MPRDSALDDLSVLTDPNWKPPSAGDIADWSRSAIKILSLADNLSSDLNDSLAESQRIRSSVLLRRSSLENEFASVDRELNAQLAVMPEDLQGYNIMRKKNRQKELAERQTREMLIADGFMSAEAAQEILEDDEALVELGSQRLQELLAPPPPLIDGAGDRNGNMDTMNAASSVLSMEGGINYEEEEGGEKRVKVKKKVRRRRRKRGATGNNGRKHGSGTSSSNDVDNSGNLIVSSTGSVVLRSSTPSVETNLDSSSRILAVMEAERKREEFRSDTLSSLLSEMESSSTSKERERRRMEHVQMEKIFSREKRQAERIIADMLDDYTPRPLPKQSPTKQQARQAKASKANTTTGSTGPSPLQRGGLVANLRESMGRGGPQTNFSTTNKMPGAALEVAPPTMPGDLDVDTLNLEDQRRNKSNSSSNIDAGMKDLIASHTQEMDLSFPEIEKYKKPGQEHARYLENNIVM